VHDKIDISNDVNKGDSMLLTRRDVQERLGVSEPTMYRWIYNGTLPAIRVGRLYKFEPRDIEKLLQSRRVTVK
jgi:excisionase family DNA binding protein